MRLIAENQSLLNKIYFKLFYIFRCLIENRSWKVLRILIAVRANLADGYSPVKLVCDNESDNTLVHQCSILACVDSGTLCAPTTTIGTKKNWRNNNNDGTAIKAMRTAPSRHLHSSIQVKVEQYIELNRNFFYCIQSVFCVQSTYSKMRPKIREKIYTLLATILITFGTSDAKMKLPKRKSKKPCIPLQINSKTNDKKLIERTDRSGFQITVGHQLRIKRSSSGKAHYLS